MLIVVAIADDVLSFPENHLDYPQMLHQQIRKMAKNIAEMASNYDLIVCYGNRQHEMVYQNNYLSDIDDKIDFTHPAQRLDVSIACQEGAVGYMLEQEILNQLPHSHVAVLLTQVEVDRNDPAFAFPRKTFGKSYTKTVAEQLIKRYGWKMVKENKMWRRVVASPEPRRIIGLESIKSLMMINSIIICAGGGGIPVTRNENNQVIGVEAAIDENFTAALLAKEVGADALLFLSDIKQKGSKYRKISYLPSMGSEQFTFDTLSIAAQVEAASRFVEHTNKWAAIGALEDGLAILQGTRGTYINLTKRIPAEIKRLGEKVGYKTTKGSIIYPVQN